MSEDENSIDDVNPLLETPWLFAQRIEPKRANTLKQQLKSIYDRLKLLEYKDQSQSSVVSSTLPELVVQSLDEEQIWQQIELQNDSVSRRMNKIIGKLPVSNHASIFQCINSAKSKSKPIKPVENNYEEQDLNDSKEADKDLDDRTSAADSDQEEMGSHKKVNFFNKKEMDAFLDAEDNKEMDKMDGEKKEDNDADLDLLEDEEDSEEDIDGSKNYRYKDFFGVGSQRNKLAKKVKFDIESHDDEECEEMYEEVESVDEGLGASDEIQSNSDTEPKSSFEIRQEKLKQKIENFEKKNVAEKPWQQTGEVWAKNRPENSLLEEFVEFEHTTKLPPIITEQTTKSLEDVVRQRIKDKAYDDVERKIKPINEPQRYKNDMILDQQKSKVSLSQIYEQEYLKQHKVEREEVKNEQHEEIRRLMKELFVKLDALTNYHYTPKLPSTEIKIVSNTKSISVEEVAPVVVTDADMLAPEEVKAKSRTLIKSTDEKTKTDKLRDLRRKKKLATLKAKRNEEKEKRAKVPKDKLKMLQKLGKIHKVKNVSSATGSKSKSSRKVHEK